MQIDSIQVGQPREVSWEGKIHSTSIFKSRIEGPVAVRNNNIEGDKQADLRVHGGADKAIYAYATEHYDSWRKEIQLPDDEPGLFGENLTISGGLFEDQIMAGDSFKVGSCILKAVQPRLPCFKLGIRFGDADFPRVFSQHDRPGVYFRIEQEGSLNTGDQLEHISREQDQVSILDMANLMLSPDPDRSILEATLALPNLPEMLRPHLSRLLQRMNASG